MAFPTLFGHESEKNGEWWQIPILAAFGASLFGAVIHHLRIRMGQKVLEPLQPWEILLLIAMPYLWIILHFRRKNAKKEWEKQALPAYKVADAASPPTPPFADVEAHPERKGRLNQETTLDRVLAMSGLQFEQFMASLFRTRGYSVHLTRASGDQGVDLLLSWGGRRIAIQLKRHTLPVGNAAVQAVFAGQHFYQAEEAWVITTSTFTTSAKELATKLRVRLIDGQELVHWIENP